MNNIESNKELIASSQLLLDTHIIIWYAEGIKLSESHVEKIENARKNQKLFISQISIWEIAILINKERLSFSLPLKEWIDKLLSIDGLSLLDLTTSILVESCQLPSYAHKDPVDRMIIATARCLNIELMTADQKILDYGSNGYVKIA